MSLSVGIVGLPNAGKSTLFNALSARRLAETAPRPFTTIEPHEAVVPVPDDNLAKLHSLIKPDETVPSTITFIDIAGLVKDAHKGEGLGNQFLAKVREVDAIVHVVRGFVDPMVVHQHQRHQVGSYNQIKDDIEIVNLELLLAGIEKKPMIYAINVGEQALVDDVRLINWKVRVTEKFKDPTIIVAAKLEEDLSDLKEKEKSEYLKQSGVEETGLEQLIKWGYSLLDLITFYTIKGGKEVHAWSLKKGSTAIDAAGVVHTDFAQNFIKAEAIPVADLLTSKGWKEAKNKGKVKLEGRDYIVKDNDVIEFIVRQQSN